VNPDTDRVYVSAVGASVIAIIDGSTNSQIVTISVPEFSYGILAPLVLCITLPMTSRKLRKASRKRTASRNVE